MSQFAPAPQKPDGRIFASYPMPAKIDLINERPRRESVVERQLDNLIGQQTSVPKIEVTEQHVTHSYSTQVNSAAPASPAPPERNVSFNNYQEWNRQVTHNHSGQVQQSPTNRSPQLVQQHEQSSSVSSQPPSAQNQRTTGVIFSKEANNALFAAELAEKEAKRMAEIKELHQRPYSPFQMPSKIDLTNEQRKAQQQFEHAPSPRPTSRASSTRSTSADLMDKEAKLLQEIEEMGKKPYNPQTMVVEREQWFEYPQGNPHSRQLTDSKRRVKDFCSLPSHMYNGMDNHIHEENLPASAIGRPSSSAGSIHTTIIRSPKQEVDNSAPLPFAFDNFSTKGVRGNIASVGAIEPERPRPPIYPIIKRTPSPNMARG